MNTHPNHSTLIWRDPPSWVNTITSWLLPKLCPDALTKIRAANTHDYYADDDAWIELLRDQLRPDTWGLTDDLCEYLNGWSARCYHGCRTDDAGKYFRDGLRTHRQEELEARLKDLVITDKRLRNLVPNLDTMIARFADCSDHHKCYAVLDDRNFLERGGAHYLIYGSEWMCSVLGPNHRNALLDYGSPTVIEIDAPLSMTPPSERKALANIILTEWTRQTAIAPAEPTIWDYSFIWDQDIKPEYIVGHYHPEFLVNPLENMTTYHSNALSCRFCV